MGNEKKIFKIPKDPRTDNDIFITEFPLNLLNLIDQNEWYDCIDQINNVFIENNKYSFWNMLKLFLIIPAFYRIKTYEKDMKRTLEAINLKLNPKGIRIEDPIANGYTELVVIYTEKQ